MKSLFKLMCITMLLCGFSYERTMSERELCSTVPERRIQNLVSQARNGEAEVYCALAACYLK